MPSIVTYRIANHFFSIEGDAEVQLLGIIPGFPLFRCENPQQPEWLVRFGCALSKPDNWEVLYSTISEEGGYQFVFAKASDGFYFFMDGQPGQTDGTSFRQGGQPTQPAGNSSLQEEHPEQPDGELAQLDGKLFNHHSSAEPLLMRYAGGTLIEATACVDFSALRFALWMAYGMFAASSHVVLIHSSVIVHQGKAVLFLGESGTGKSTHTRLWLQHIPGSRLLNDDSPILTVENGCPMVYGTPWSGKTHHYHPVSFPLAAAVRLSQAPANRMSRLGHIEAFAALQPSCPPALAQDDYFSDHIIALLGDVISSVPVYHLACLPDAAAAQMSHDAIFSNR